jgi:hypothetical protein
MDQLCHGLAPVSHAPGIVCGDLENIPLDAPLRATGAFYSWGMVYAPLEPTAGLSGAISRCGRALVPAYDPRRCTCAPQEPPTEPKTPAGSKTNFRPF